MDDRTLPSEYDAIILGTGMSECILAAALSRIGQKVLHLDRNDYYSGDWATFNFKSLLEWINNQNSVGLEPCESCDTSSILKDGEKLLPLDLNSNTISNVSEKRYVRLKADLKQPAADTEHVKPAQVQDSTTSTPSGTHTEVETHEDSVISKTETDDSINATPTNCEANAIEESSSDKDVAQTSVGEQDTQPEKDRVEKCSEMKAKEDIENWTMEKIESQWRKFNIDIMPKILFSRGPMVELLIASDIAKYCEFRAVTRVLTLINDQLQTVPCSRADVFSSKQVNMIEKRMLMKLLTFCANYKGHPQEYAGFEDKPFVDFLKSKKLSSNVTHYVLHAIAMATDNTNTMDGLQRTQKFIQSLGRYGNTAFLWPLYGSGEIPQCFCRVCAVFGGVYCLRRTAQSLIADSQNVFQGIIDTEGQKLTAKWLVMDSSYASDEILPNKSSRRISRAILLTPKSIFPDSQQHITLMSLPAPAGGSEPITVYELSTLSMACPQGLFVIHMICDTVVDAETDLGPAVDKLFNRQPVSADGEDTTNSANGDTTKPRVLWSMFFNIRDSSSEQPQTDQLPENVHILPGPDSQLDMDTAILKARQLFEKLCPDEEFLPKAPNPEDIIFEGMEGGSGFTEDPDKPEQGTGESKPDPETAETDPVPNPDSETTAERPEDECKKTREEDPNVEQSHGSDVRT